MIGVNSTLEEPRGQAHWWWDTHTPNDGGVQGDMVMREFYRYCRVDTARSNKQQQPSTSNTPPTTTSTTTATTATAATTASSTTTPATGATDTTTTDATAGAGADADATDKNSQPSAAAKAANKEGKKGKTSGSGLGLGCAFSNFTVITMNVASNDDSGADRERSGNGVGDGGVGAGSGKSDGGIGAGNGACGVRVLQQQHSLQPSNVHVTCHHGRQVLQSNFIFKNSLETLCTTDNPIYYPHRIYKRNLT